MEIIIILFDAGANGCNYMLTKNIISTDAENDEKLYILSCKNNLYLLEFFFQSCRHFESFMLAVI